MPDGDTTTAVGDLSFYDHHRQRYGHLPLRDGFREFHVGDYGPANEPNHGVGEGGELSIILHRFNDGRLHPELRVFADAYGSLRALIDSGTLDLIEKSEIETADDLTAILLGARWLPFRMEWVTVGGSPPWRPLLWINPARTRARIGTRRHYIALRPPSRRHHA